MAVFHGRSSISSTNCGARSDLSATGPSPHPQRLYGRKRGRPLRPGQQVLFEELLPSLTIELPQLGELNPALLFPESKQSVWLEIGFGAGEHLAAQAEAYPDIGFIGCEVFENGVAKLLREIEGRRLANIRLFTDDAHRLIAALPPASISRVFILFPDPWPKARHHKRRIVSTETLDELARIMTEGAELRLATDDREYFVWMLERVTSHPGFVWLARKPADWRQRTPDWLPTRYEEKARAAGRSPLFLRARRQSTEKTPSNPAASSE
jgi:tRNA (guanine-N7-)-methyltransferase